jgi:insulysin
MFLFKYPKENTFAKFIEENAGSSNAYTSGENTNYHFEISNPNLKEALDMYLKHFISLSKDKT